MKPYIFALCANLSFALGSVFFTHYSRRVSSLWMNSIKAYVGVGCFFIAVLFTSGFHSISFTTFIIFFISGFLALGIGDLFLLESFKLLGPGRTMVLFGFQPLIIGSLSFLVFDQSISSRKLVAVIFLILCLLTFSFEIRKNTGSWEFRNLLIAFTGILIDAVGVIIIRYAFDLNEQITGFEGNVYRCLGAITAYFCISFIKPIQFKENFVKFSFESRFFVLLGAFIGTFLSLGFHLEAVKIGHLASISAISITAVIFASLFECIWERRKPSWYLLVALFYFGIGMYILLK